ncbi:MAG: radical SAM family heme chaperone HemW [Tissierellia bacterium]|nr:radical SAM family heme chaperone HemW [Tissierellia bacterium]
MMKTNSLGLYIHIPFCNKKCDYCDFVSVTDFSVMDTYLSCLEEEISFEPETSLVDTIFIGGGTPSLLSQKQLDSLFNTIYKAYKVDEKSEITIELNPESVTKEKLKAYKEMGINRLSMGVQTFDDRLLKSIGRINNMDKAISAYKMIEKSGIDNVNLDLMMALPNQSLTDIVRDLEWVDKLMPNHISYYSLIIEEDTPLAKRFKGTDENLDRIMYHKIREALTKAGYKHYELSNWSKAGYSCKHNIKYWKINDYRGYGVASHSSVGGFRFNHGDDVLEYIKNPHNVARELIGTEERLSEFLIMGIRLMDGLSRKEIVERFGQDIWSKRDRFFSLIKNGLISMDEKKILLTDKGMDLCNVVEEVLFSL